MIKPISSEQKKVLTPPSIDFPQDALAAAEAASFYVQNNPVEIPNISTLQPLKSAQITSPPDCSKIQRVARHFFSERTNRS